MVRCHELIKSSLTCSSNQTPNLEFKYYTKMSLLSKCPFLIFRILIHLYYLEILCVAKGQLISKRLLQKIIWTKIATKKFDNFCPGGQIKKIKTLYYIKYPIIDIRKCLYFFYLTTRAEIVKFFRCYFGPNDFFQKAF